MQNPVRLRERIWAWGCRISEETREALAAGAEVINVEPPGGDPLRKLTPFGREEYMLESRITGEKCGLDFIHEMRGQKSVTINLETEEGRAIYKTLAGQVDGEIDGNCDGVPE